MLRVQIEALEFFYEKLLNYFQKANSKVYDE